MQRLTVPLPLELQRSGRPDEAAGPGDEDDHGVAGSRRRT